MNLEDLNFKGKTNSVFRNKVSIRLDFVKKLKPKMKIS